MSSSPCVLRRVAHHAVAVHKIAFHAVTGLLLMLPITVISSSHTSATPVPSATTVKDGVIEIIEQPFIVRNSQYGVFRIAVPEAIATDNNAIIEVRVHRRVTSRDQLREISDTGAIPRVTDVAQVALPNVPTDSNNYLLVRIPLQASNQGLSGLYMAEPGVYPVSVVARQNNLITAQTLTYLHRTSPADTDNIVTTSLVVALRATPSIQPDGTVLISDDVRERIRRFIDTLTSINTPVTVAVQPEIVSSLRLSTVNNDQELFANLQQVLAGRALTLLPFVPIDVSAARRAGVSEEYLRQLRLGEDVLLQLLPNSTVQRTTAVVSDPLDDEGFDLIRDSGRRTVIALPNAMQSFGYQSSPSVKSRQSRNDGSIMTLLLADQPLQKALISPIEKPVERAYRVAAELLMHRTDLLNAKVSSDQLRFIISTSDGTAPNQLFISTLMNVLRQESVFNVADIVSDSDATPDSPPVNVPEEATGNITERVLALAQLQTERAATASMLPENDPRTFLWQQLDGLIISSMVTDYVPYIDGLRGQFQSLRESITLANPGAITLGSRNGTIRFQIRNTAPENLAIRIAVDSPKLEFPGGSKLVTLTGSSTTDVEIPVSTRTNGRFPVTLTITTPDGDLNVIEPITFSARVTALAGLGQFVMISFVLIVLAWWWASWRKSRREREQAGTVPIA